MAEGFFARIGNLWSGFMSLWIKDRENENPEAVFEAAINQRVKQYGTLKEQVSNILYLRNKLAIDHEKKEAELREVMAQIPVAVDAGEDEVALVLLERKNALQAEIASIDAELATISEEAEAAKATLLSFRSEIDKLKKEKEVLLARKETAEARIQIQDQLSSLSPEADIKALENVREHIGQLQAQAEIGQELDDTSLESKLASIRQRTGNIQAQSELAALKAARLQRAEAEEQNSGDRTAEATPEKSI